jgi:hypothetical protein
MVASESGAIPASGSVSAALAVLAGIAASDATCCATQGERSGGQDHKRAVELIRQAGLNGPKQRRSWTGSWT